MTSDEFKILVDEYPKHSGDTNLIFSLYYSEYKNNVEILETYSLMYNILKNEFTAAVSGMDNTQYQKIITEVGALHSIVKSSLLSPFSSNMKISQDVATIGNNLLDTYNEYLQTISSDFFNILQDVKYGINNDLKLGSGIVGNIVRDLLKLKDAMIINVLGDEYYNIVLPLIAYENFTKDHEIFETITTLSLMEKFLIKQDVITKPKKDLIHPDTNKLYSVHYRNEYNLNYDGSIDIKNMISSNTLRAQLSNIIKVIDNFRLTLI